LHTHARLTRSDPDTVTFDLAAAQHGVVSRAQLLRAGLPASTIRGRVRARRLKPLHRGVYQVGPIAGPRVAEMAAVLACGGGSAGAGGSVARSVLVSHRSAAALWKLMPARTDGIVEVLVVGNDRRGRRGVRVHRTDALADDDSARLEGVPLTSAARTLLDLAGTLPARDLERALASGERAGVVDRVGLLAFMSRRPGRTRAASLRALLADAAAPALTRSEAEERLLALIRKSQLRTPETNVVVHGFELDFLWRAERLAVEVDGFAFHRSARSFERDRRRDAALTAHGVRVMRVTWRQIVSEPEATLVRLAQALAR
jgi:very-short-patch-repair endonuclease